MHHSKKTFLAALPLAVAMAVSGDVVGSESSETQSFTNQRRQLQHRPRRIIYNNDGNDIRLKELSTPAEFLQQRIEPALGTQVDSIFYCTCATTIYHHDTDVAERMDDQADAIQATEGPIVKWRDNMRMLRAAGKDCLELVVERCHEAGVEIFWTHRINDVHDSIPNLRWLLSQWKREHPEYLLGKPEDWETHVDAEPRQWWSALDFAKSEVTDYLCRINEEVCQRYDVDGIEIDYFRSPMFFKPNLDYKPATDEQVEIMTAFQRRTREIARREGQRRGRPILVAVRVPMTVEKCRYVGIDIEAWLAEDLVDLLVTGGGYVPFTMPTKELVELGHAYDVPVYPAISGSGMRRRERRPGERDKPRPLGSGAWRAVAANAWHNGADGMYTFNHFPGKPENPIFMTIGDPEGLAEVDKTFIIDNWGCHGGSLEYAVVQSQILPKELDSTGKPLELVLPVGDDVAGAAKAGRLRRVSLRLSGKGLEAHDAVQVRVNGVEAPAQDERQYAGPGRIGGAIRFDGTNVLSAGAGESMQITDGDFSLSLWVKTRQKDSWSGFVVFVEWPAHLPGPPISRA